MPAEDRWDEFNSKLDAIQRLLNAHVERAFNAEKAAPASGFCRDERGGRENKRDPGVLLSTNLDSPTSIWWLMTTIMIMAYIGTWVFRRLRKEALLYNQVKLDFKQKGLFSDFVAYRLDYILSAMDMEDVFCIVLVCVILVVVLGGVVLFVFSILEHKDMSEDSFGTFIWQAWVFIADAGAHGSVEEPLMRIGALLITIVGLIIFALVISMTSEGVQTRFDNLRKGTAKVMETKHYLILGWSSKVKTLVSEICTSAWSEGGRCIVIMADIDKEELEKRVADISLQRSILVCRKGDPCNLADMKHVSAKYADSICIVANDNRTPAESDHYTLRICMCLNAMGFEGGVAAELKDGQNRELLVLVGLPRLEIIVCHDFMGMMLVQCARQKGLSEVLESILGFDGCEFYLKEWPELCGIEMKYIHYYFDAAIVLGIKSKDTGLVKMNVENDYVIQEGDEILVLADDDDTYWPRGSPFKVENLPGYFKDEISTASKITPQITGEKMLIINSRAKMMDLVDESFLSGTSEVTIFTSKKTEISAEDLEGEEHLEIIMDDFSRDNISDILGKKTYDHILVLSEQNDSTILARLLVLQDCLVRNSILNYHRRAIRGEGRDELLSPVHGIATSPFSHNRSDSPRSHRNAGGQDKQPAGRQDKQTMTILEESDLTATIVSSDELSENDDVSQYKNQNKKKDDGGEDGTARNSPTRAAELRKTTVVSAREGDFKSATVVSDTPFSSPFASSNFSMLDEGGPLICAELEESTTRELLAAMLFEGSCLLTNQLCASVLAMVAVNAEVVHILDAFFNPANHNRIALRPCSRYVDLSGIKDACFWDIMAIVRNKGEILLGVAKNTANSKKTGMNITLNPLDKDRRMPADYWMEEHLVVLRKKPLLAPTEEGPQDGESPRIPSIKRLEKFGSQATTPNQRAERRAGGGVFASIPTAVSPNPSNSSSLQMGKKYSRDRKSWTAKNPIFTSTRTNASVRSSRLSTKILEDRLREDLAAGQNAGRNLLTRPKDITSVHSVENERSPDSTQIPSNIIDTDTPL